LGQIQRLFDQYELGASVIERPVLRQNLISTPPGCEKYENTVSRKSIPFKTCSVISLR
jgi:hypothetical protein